MFKVGLTGGIASGKSTVSTILRNKGLQVLDADLIAREVFKLYPWLSENIKKEFGQHFFDAGGCLRRKELGEYIFKYPTERIKLEALMIPVIKEEIFKRLSELDNKGTALCIVDAPTLIEHGIHEQMDMNIVVWVDRNTQIERLKKRDGLNNEQAVNRLNAQMSLEEKRAFADFIIDNSKSIENTRQQVEEIVKVLDIYNQ